MTVKSNLFSLGGNLEFSIESYKDSRRILYLLIQKHKEPVIVLGLVVQYLTNDSDIIYIESLDTTGCFKPRDNQSTFTKQFVISVLNSLNSNFICTFSHPKEELIFGNSSNNSEKGKLSPRRLMNYWISIFKQMHPGKIDITSNYHSPQTYPKRYKKLEDLYLFEDDPKRKQLDEAGGQLTVRELFKILVHRKDFTKGSLIYFTSEYITHQDLSKNSSYIEYEINDILTFLRKADFSNLENAMKATSSFYDKYPCKKDWFFTDHKKEIKKIANEKTSAPIITITPRKK